RKEKERDRETMCFFFSNRRRNTKMRNVTGVPTYTLPIIVYFYSLCLHGKYDLLGAVSYLKSRDHTGDNIGVIGFSMGAATSLLAASESDDIKAVIADSPFRNAGLFLREGLPFFSGLPAFQFSYTLTWMANWAFKVVLDSISPLVAVKKCQTDSEGHTPAPLSVSAPPSAVFRVAKKTQHSTL
ncbi:hypothetical protein E4V51_30230, partial [Paenibacillus sp. 28ISP30-2]|nr:hypothetical protein [Paenibacillus sp. 28ISP30-2]